MKYFYDDKRDVLLILESGDIRELRGMGTLDVGVLIEEPVGQKEPKKSAKQVLLRKSPSGSKREKVLELIAKGLNDKEIAEQVGISPAGVYYYRSSKVIKQQEQRKEAAEGTAKNQSSASNDYGLGFQAVGLIIDARRNSEKSDQEIGNEFDVSASQVKVLWHKYYKDPRFNS